MKRKVRVKGPGVKLNNIWCYINEVAVIDEAQYEENKDYVEVIEEIKENQETKSIQETKSDDGTDINVGSNEGEKQTPEDDKNENPKGDSEDNSDENNEDEDEELVKLREEAKELGIRGAHNMKKENLITKTKEMTEGSETENNTEDIELSKEN